jgi:hypothetical protein
METNNLQQQQSTQPTSYSSTEIFDMFKAYTEANYSDFVLDDTNVGVIKKMAEIAAGESDKRGLVLRGTVGTGKTLLFLIFTEFRQKILKMQYVSYSDWDGAPSYSDIDFSGYDQQSLFSKYREIENKLFARNLGRVLFLDDIGESSEVNNFGTKVNLVSEMILARYKDFKHDFNLELYVTTNSTSTQLKKAIGERAFSRLLEMCYWNEGLLAGVDRRQSDKIVKKWPEIRWKQLRVLA